MSENKNKNEEKKENIKAVVKPELTAEQKFIDRKLKALNVKGGVKSAKSINRVIVNNMGRNK